MTPSPVLRVTRARARLQPIRSRFEKGESFWINPDVGLNAGRNAFGRSPPPGEGWFRSAPALVDPPGLDLLPSDDWQQLYLRSREIPWAPLGQGMLTVAVLSVALLALFAPVRRVRPNWQMVFLGGGFMLLETKAGVQLGMVLV